MILLSSLLTTFPAHLKPSVANELWKAFMQLSLATRILIYHSIQFFYFGEIVSFETTMPGSSMPDTNIPMEKAVDVNDIPNEAVGQIEDLQVAVANLHLERLILK